MVVPAGVVLSIEGNFGEVVEFSQAANVLPVHKFHVFLVFKADPVPGQVLDR